MSSVAAAIAARESRHLTEHARLGLLTVLGHGVQHPGLDPKQPQQDRTREDPEQDQPFDGERDQAEHRPGEQDHDHGEDDDADDHADRVVAAARAVREGRELRTPVARLPRPPAATDLPYPTIRSDHPGHRHPRPLASGEPDRTESESPRVTALESQAESCLIHGFVTRLTWRAYQS
ncbi:hypothetical protein [Carbonactinospora thermoautotrophica]|uniref:hypothetical protein n=1 Tax=Carbonactinospora thermoautotrophica TaxID=1469144 RepID=UPI0022712E95|nr:hypothetical protein [Carbonactinospora thermoautotrophica]